METIQWNDYFFGAGNLSLDKVWRRNKKRNSALLRQSIHQRRKEAGAPDIWGCKFPLGLAPDPMNEEIGEQFSDIVVGKPETFKDQLKPILSNERLFFTDLYKDGIGEKIEEMFREMIAGPGAVKATIHKYVH